MTYAGVSSFLEFRKQRKIQVFLKRKSRQVLDTWIGNAFESFPR